MSLLFDRIQFTRPQTKALGLLDTLGNGVEEPPSSEGGPTGISGEEAKKFYEKVVTNTSDEGKQLYQPQKPAPKVKPKFRKNWHRAKNFGQLKLSAKNRFLRAATDGDERTLVDCLKNGVDVNIADQWGWTALMCAVSVGNLNSVQLLISAGIRTGLRNRAGETALDLAKKLKGFEIMEYLDAVENSNSELNNDDQGDMGSESQRYCSPCDAEVKDNDHGTSMAHLLNTTEPTVHTTFLIPKSNRGYKLLVRDGWNQRSGLGAKAQGRQFPVKTLLKRDRKGLGSKTGKKPKVTHFGPFDPAAVNQVGPLMSAKSGKKLRKRQELEKEKNDRNIAKRFRREFYTAD